ncbi:DNA polymerase I catalytic subunit [Staphylococcus phage MarsHill]|nr:DNA polymerase I catalytic subunit [Staphylococcus phage MarsHill]QQO92763.1 DNA polymerase catalytic subunit [Staphylococcus phage Madawaska]
MSNQDNKYERKRAITGYLENLIKLIKIRKPDIDNEKLINACREYIKKHVDPALIEISGQKMNVDTTLRQIIDNNLIVTGSGSIYQPQSQRKNLNADMLKDFIDSRKVAKHNMFIYKGKDDVLHDKYMNEQKTIKILANSYYGAMIQKNSTFYDSNSGPATTYSGVDIVTTSAIALERFIGGKIFFMNIAEIYHYILRIINEKYEDHDIKIKSIPTDRKILEDLVSNIEEDYSEEEFLKLEDVFSKLSQEDKNKVYFKNNLSGLIDHTDIFENKISKMTGREDFLDPNEPPEDLIPLLDELFEILKDWVIYNYQDYNRMYRMNYKKRRSVLTIDTDSNFVHLDPLYEKMKSLKPEDFPIAENGLEDKLEQRVGNISIINYQITKLLELSYYRFCKDVGLEEEHLGLISMKNEYLDKQLTTDKKKTYASSVIQQEGNLVQPPDLDVKGMAIRKVNTNKRIRELFTEILQKDILENKTGVDRIKIIRKFKDIEEMIKKSLDNGEIEFLKPFKANNAEVYKDPYSQMAYRAALAWNIMYPEKEIALPAKILAVKLNISTFGDIKNKITDEDTLNRFREVFKNESLVKNGLNVIAVEGNTIPEEFRPFIDYDSMIEDHIKPGKDIIESIGVRVLESSNSSFVSNMIKF